MEFNEGDLLMIKRNTSGSYVANFIEYVPGHSGHLFAIVEKTKEPRYENKFMLVSVEEISHLTSEEKFQFLLEEQ